MKRASPNPNTDLTNAPVPTLDDAAFRTALEALAAETKFSSWARTNGRRLHLINRSEVNIPALFEPNESAFWLANLEIAYLVGDDAPFKKPVWGWNRHSSGRDLWAIAPVLDFIADPFVTYTLREYAMKKSGDRVWMATRKVTRYQHRAFEVLISEPHAILFTETRAAKLVARLTERANTDNSPFWWILGLKVANLYLQLEEKIPCHRFWKPSPPLVCSTN